MSSGRGVLEIWDVFSKALAFGDVSILSEEEAEVEGFEAASISSFSDFVSVPLTSVESLWSFPFVSAEWEQPVKFMI